MSFIRPERPKPITARPSKWVWFIVAWYLLAIVIAATVFQVNTQGFMFGSLPVTFAILAGWGWVCASVSIDLWTRLERRPNYRNEILIAVSVVLLASGVVGMEKLKDTLRMEVARSEAYLASYRLMNHALDAAERYPGDIQKIKRNYGKTLMKEMFVAAGIKEEWLDQDGAFAHEE